MAQLPIRTAGWEDEDRLGALLSVSFTDDPYVRWLLPNALDLSQGCKVSSLAFEVFHTIEGGELVRPLGVQRDRSRLLSPQ